MNTNVPIKFINSTDNADVQVIVANDPGSPDSKYVVWHILRTQTEADFVYPAETGVGAYYFNDNIKLVMGPFSANLGSTWEIHQEEKHSPKLKEVTNQDVNNEGTVVVKNLKPPGWSGRKYNIGLYKSDNLLVVKENFPVGEGARLNLETILYFGIVKSKICLGQTISGEEISILTPFDITEYLGGLQVTLSAEANSGKHSFSGLNIEEDTDHAQENTDHAQENTD